LYIIAFLLLAVVSPVFLRVFFSKWDQEHAVQTKRTETLIDAGLLIGIMERLMIAFFIQIDFLEGIGFLLAAKSIFRFGDLTNAKNTKFTEYVLVGTLASFLIAIIIGYAVKLVSENVT
jgi:general stress protein CsbA